MRTRPIERDCLDGSTAFPAKGRKPLCHDGMPFGLFVIPNVTATSSTLWLAKHTLGQNYFSL